MTKIKVEKLTKVFGKKPKQALQMLDNNKSKEEILAATGCTVGVNQASLKWKMGKFSL